MSDLSEHRRKLLDAIAAVRAEASAPTPLSDAPPATDKAAQDTAERRQVTVMFSDLVGSTALSARMDPEDLREVISAYQKCVAETVRRFGGFVAKYMGDGVLVYFGYPQAHEDDAERAVRAGLELIAAVTALKSPRSPANPRWHRHWTGRRRRPDRIGRGAGARHRRRDAEPRGAPARDRRAEHRGHRRRHAQDFSAICSSLQDLGAKDLKGIAGPVRAWAALRASAVESRFEALHASGLTALVGREEEIELLLRRWSRAKRAEGQVVLLSGEAGIGKSRLTAALLERLSGERPRACAISARRSTRTVHSIRSLARWNAPPDWRTTTNRKRSSTSLMRFSHRPRPRRRMPHSSPRCCRSPMMGAIPCLSWPRSSAGKERWKR